MAKKLQAVMVINNSFLFSRMYEYIREKIIWKDISKIEPNEIYYLRNLSTETLQQFIKNENKRNS